MTELLSEGIAPFESEIRRTPRQSERNEGSKIPNSLINYLRIFTIDQVVDNIFVEVKV